MIVYIYEKNRKSALLEKIKNVSSVESTKSYICISSNVDGNEEIKTYDRRKNKIKVYVP